MIQNPMAKSALLDLIYPIGSVYMSVQNVSPEDFLGGTWEQIQGQFLLAASSTYPAGSTGGEAEHALTEDELPEIGGYITATSSGSKWSIFGTAHGVFSVSGPIAAPTNDEVYTGGNTRSQRMDMSFGGNQPHNNMPPYLSVYMWKRTG